jgi:hypothetical protein
MTIGGRSAHMVVILFNPMRGGYSTPKVQSPRHTMQFR